MKTNRRGKTNDALYRRADAPVEARVEDLLGRMTLEEKVCQMGAAFPTSWEDPKINRLLTNGRFSPRKAAAILSPGPGHVSMPLRYLPIRKSVAFANAIQKFLVEHTRLGIPAIIHDESLHGCMLPGSTSFPQAIGLAGDEVVQLYLSDLCASLSRPVKELKRFQRVRLARGQKRVVRFTLEGRELAFLDRHLEPVVEPGEFEVMVGGSSAEGIKARFDVKADVVVKRECA
jgi:hypothetical protein